MKIKKYSPLVIVILGTFGLLVLFLNTYFNPDIENTNSAFAQSVGLLKYFTVQSNIIVVSYFWMLFALPKLRKNEIFNKLIGGVTVYITITFVVFAIMLQKTFTPEGWGVVSNLLNHYITPILVITYLVVLRKDYTFGYKDIKTWIVYPVLYIIFVIIFGSITGDYLYPFFQIGDIGMGMFLLMVVGLVAFFIILSILFMKIVSQKNVEN